MMRIHGAMGRAARIGSAHGLAQAQRRHASSLLGSLSAWLQRLQEARGIGDYSRVHIHTDERGNKYFVKQAVDRMVAQTSHVKELRSVEYATGGSAADCD